jgi:predicted ATP-grasp superfamily ATP-dependent carboligase
MLRIFVYEYFTGGGLDGPPRDDDERELLAAGTAMREAIVGDLLRAPGTHVTVADTLGTAPTAAHGIAPAPDESPEAFVRRMARLHDASWIVAPETDGMLERLREAVGDAGWIGCDAGAIHCAASKSATLARLAGHGVPTPRAGGPGHRGRWIVKPDDGAGTVATRLHPARAAAHADLEARRAAGRCATLEPFIEGEALSISMIVGANLATPVETVAFNRQRIEAGPEGWLRDAGVRSAEIDERHDPRAGALRGLALQVADAMPGLRGFVGIDLIWNEEQGPVAIEVNPRVTSAYVGLSSRLGRNLAAEILRSALAPEAGRALAP